MKNYFDYFKHPKKLLILFLKKFGGRVPDKLYLQILFFLRRGERLNLASPRGFNAKCQWLKLYYHDPKLTQMADKYEVKKIVADKIGDEYVVPASRKI